MINKGLLVLMVQCPNCNWCMSTRQYWAGWCVSSASYSRTASWLGQKWLIWKPRFRSLTEVALSGGKIKGNRIIANFKDQSLCKLFHIMWKTICRAMASCVLYALDWLGRDCSCNIRTRSGHRDTRPWCVLTIGNARHNSWSWHSTRYKRHGWSFACVMPSHTRRLHRTAQCRMVP